MRITEDNVSNRSTEPVTPEIEEMLTAPVPAVYNENIQTMTPKSMVLDLGWFDRDRIKFKDWWRGIQLFLKNNKVVVTDDKITVVLAQFKGGIVRIYIQKKINKLEDCQVQFTLGWKSAE